MAHKAEDAGTLIVQNSINDGAAVRNDGGSALYNEGDGKYYCGYCNADISNMAAEVTYVDGTTGYIENLADALSISSNVVSVKLLKNISVDFVLYRF